MSGDEPILEGELHFPEKVCTRCGRRHAALGVLCDRCLNLDYRRSALERERQILAQTPDRPIECTSGQRSCHLVLSMNRRMAWCGVRALVRRDAQPRYVLASAQGLPANLCKICRDIYDTIKAAR